MMKNKKALKWITFFWLAMLIFSLINIFIVGALSESIESERQVLEDKVEMISLGYILTKKSDYLTAEARNFAVTANPKHLMNYWDEVLIRKNRDYVVTRLEQLSANKNEIALIEQSKRNSDALILSEMRSMKLVLDAYGVPEKLTPKPIQKYILPEYEKKLSANDKMLLAQHILFDQKYYDDKEMIRKPAAEFKERLKDRKNQELKAQKNQVDTYIRFLFLSLSCLAVCIFCIIWLRILYLK
jgi:nitrate reductase NapE component